MAVVHVLNILVNSSVQAGCLRQPGIEHGICMEVDPLGDAQGAHHHGCELGL